MHLGGLGGTPRPIAEHYDTRPGKPIAAKDVPQCLAQMTRTPVDENRDRCRDQGGLPGCNSGASKVSANAAGVFGANAGDAFAA